MDDIVKRLRQWNDELGRTLEVADYISRLEAVVREADAAFEWDCTEDRMDAYHAARSRVTLPPLTQTNQAKDGDKEDASNAT